MIRHDEASDPQRWLELHGDALFRYALTRLRRRQDAEDAVQEALLAALRARQQFRADSAERSWLIGILRHKIVDRIRVLAREDAATIPNDDGMDNWCGQSDRWLHAPGRWRADPAQLSENADFWQQVRACYGALPELQAQVFALRTFDGLSTEEICQQLGVTTTNLWVLLHRARARLRDCLESTWFVQEGGA
jgi:RNA polymerase sigma-70 factor (ECF subfamily)